MCLGLGLGQRVVVFDSFSMLNEWFSRLTAKSFDVSAGTF
jgi:hypothetical protein